MLNRTSGISILIILTLVSLISCTNGQDADNEFNGDRDTGQGGTGSGISGNSAGESGPSESLSLTDINHGLRVWLNSGCTQCHHIGDDSGGDTGPALTDVGDRFTREELVRWIRNPQSVNPDSTMPPQELSDEDLEYLARYLSTLSSDSPGAL